MTTKTTRQLTYAQAISEALVQGMEADPSVFLFGLGVDDYKGIFGTTKQAFEKFGASRVFDCPASEGALTGIAIGAALNKKRPILVHARNDFMFLTLDQMLNNAAKWKYVYAGKSSVPFVVRGIIGKGWGQGPTHSQSIQSMFAHFPGLIVAMPSSAYDMKGILLKSLEVDSPVAILEHRSLYDQKTVVPESTYTVEFGRSKVLCEGEDMTIVALSYMVPEALKAADLLKDHGISAEVIDPVTLQPFDAQTIIRSVKKTGRLIAVDTSWKSCGFAAEIAASVVESEAFASLKSPVRRITLPACPCPVSKFLEDEFYPTFQDIISCALELCQKKSGVIKKEAIVDTFIGPY